MEVGVRLKGSGIKLATALGDGGAEFVERGDVPIDDWLIHQGPEMLRGLEFGRVGRQEDESDPLGDDQALGAMPAGIVEHEDDAALASGAGRERSIILVLDNAGWHGPKDLAIPEGISLVFLPPYSPELQPAEHLWPLVDEPIANRHVASLDELSTILAARCRQLDAATLQPHTDFHWWPRPIQPS